MPRSNREPRSAAHAEHLRSYNRACYRKFRKAIKMARASRKSNR